MPRSPIAAALLFVSLPVLAQSAGTDAALAPRRTAAIAAPADALLPGFVPADALDDDQLARRIAALYERQATLLQADADGDVARYAHLLDDLVSDLRLLAERPGVMHEPRFREVYSSVLTEHERFYGEPALDRGEVYAVRAAGVDAVERGFDLGAPLLEHVTLPDLGTFQTQIAMDVNPKVDRYIQFLLNRPSHVSRLRERADTYFPMIEAILAEEGVPDELKYLAMVESALVPVAQSHAGAAGMWQFIRATGRAYGLKAERDIDDRLDPETSTRAAARHLRDLYDRFGDWQLALAGYNCNPAVIARGVRRFEEQTGRKATFWDIDHVIPRETRAYVPMFIATALILSNPDAYGMPAVERGPQYVFDRVPVSGGTRLSTVARLIDVDEAVLRALNPSLRQGRVPDVRVPHMIRIPQGMYSQFAADLGRLAPPEANGPRFVAETVNYGMRNVRPLAPQDRSEALVAIATRRAARRTLGGTPVRRDNPVEEYVAQAPPEVAQFEAQQASERARQTEVRLVAQQTPAEPSQPAEPVASAPVAVAAAAPSGPSASVVQSAVVEPEPIPADAPETATGLVAPGLLALAKESSEVAEREAAARDAEREAAASAEAEHTPVRTVSQSSERRPTTHRVRSGEYLIQIARQYGVSLSQLREWNDLDGDVVHPGQRLRVSGAGAPARRTSTASRTTTHTVRSGENLTLISRRYGVTIRQIQEWNRLSGETIRPGQRLRIETQRARG